MPIHKRDQKDSQWELGICGPRLRCGRGRGHSRQVQSANCVKINEINFILIFVQQIPQRNYHNKLFFRLHNNSSSNTGNNSNRNNSNSNSPCLLHVKFIKSDSRKKGISSTWPRLALFFLPTPLLPFSSSSPIAVHSDRRE